jgi:hypothetical protein
MDEFNELSAVLSIHAPNEYKSIQLDFQAKYILLLEEKRQMELELYQRIVNGQTPTPWRTTARSPQSPVVFQDDGCNQLLNRGAIVAIACCHSQMHYRGAEAACTLISMSMLEVLATNYLKIKPRRSQDLNQALDKDGEGWERAMKRAIQDYAVWYNKNGNPSNMYPFYDELVSLGLFKKYSGKTINEYGGYVNEGTIYEMIAQISELSYREKCAYGGIYTNSESTSAFMSTYVEDRPAGRIWVFDSHGRIYQGKSVFVLFGKIADACRFIMESLSGGICASDSVEAEMFSRQQNDPSLQHIKNCVFQSVIFKWC